MKGKSEISEQRAGSATISEIVRQQERAKAHQLCCRGGCDEGSCDNRREVRDHEYISEDGKIETWIM